MYLTRVDDDSLYPIVIAAAFLGFYLMIPYIQALFARYRINYSHYGQGGFAAELSAGIYYLIYLKFLLWGLVGGILIAISGSVYLIAVLGGDPMSLNLEHNPEIPLGAVMPLTVFIYIVLIVFMIFLRAFFQSRLRNYVFGKTELDEVVALRSNASTGGLFKVYFINLLLVVFFPGFGNTLGKGAPGALYGKPYPSDRTRGFGTIRYRATGRADLAG